MIALSPTQIWAALGRDKFVSPRQVGRNMWNFDAHDSGRRGIRIIVSIDDELATEPRGDGVNWIHASLSRRYEMPTYDDLKLLHRAVFADGWAYQVFAPPAEHVDGSVPILGHPFCLHLFGRVDGRPVLPDFTHGMGLI